MNNFLRPAATAVIWVFFLLIATKLLEFLALVHGSPLRPFHVYSLLVAVSVLVVFGHIRSVGFHALNESISRTEVAVFAVLALLVCLIAVSLGGHQADSLRFKIWPIANLVMAAAMVYFARMMGLGSIIIAAAAGALIVQLGGIFVDLWIPGAFSEWAPRPAGPPQNSNNGALLAASFLAFLCPIGLRSSPHHWLLPALLVAGPLVFVTLSRSGLILYVILTVSYVTVRAYSDQPLLFRWRHVVFAAIFIPCLALTAVASPTLHGNITSAMWKSRVGFSLDDLLPSASTPMASKAVGYLGLVQETFGRKDGTSVQENNASQEMIDTSIKQSDDTANFRMEAMRFFWNVGLQHPLFGVGTGYGYTVQPGPHNQFIALVAEQGFPALILYLILLALVTAIALYRRSPLLLTVIAIGAINSMLSHTVIVEPGYLVFVCAAMGVTGSRAVACSA